MTLTAEFAAAGFGAAGLAGRSLAGAAGLAALDEAHSAGLPFQRAGWIAAHVAAHDDLTRFRLLIVEGPDARLLLPLRQERRLGIAIADFVGGKHASFRAPRLVGRADLWPKQALRRALAEAARGAGIDALTLRDCPFDIAGKPNPLAGLAIGPAPDAGARLTLSGGREAVRAAISGRDDQRKMRAKARKLAALGPLRFGWALTADEIGAALAALFAWKAARFSSRGIADPFAPLATRDFLARAAQAPMPAIMLFTLHAGDRLVAVMMGAVGDGQFSAMANANDLDATVLKSSPGYLLIDALIQVLINEGYQSFDLGVGEAGYKDHFCPERVSLFDCAVSASPAGHLAVSLFGAERKLKRAIKQSAGAMALVERARKLRVLGWQLA